MISTRSASSTVSTVLAVAGFALAGGCSSARVGPAQAGTYQLPECPQDWDSVVAVDDSIVQFVRRPNFPGYSLPGPITDVPEFHDCQKLLVAGGSQYGPLAAVFAAYHLDSLDDWLDTLEEKRFENRTAISAGLILNLGREYRPLGIATGFNCLYVWRTNATVTWHARVLPVGDEDFRCREHRDPKTLGTGSLSVRRDPAPGFDDEEYYPPVARWEWDESTKRQFIGIQCGAAWCQVGGSSDAWLPNPTSRSREAQIQSIKGWYDEQFLAVRDGDRVRPSLVRGIVFPDTSLKSRGRKDYQGNWLPVAYVTLSRASAEYETKFNFDRVDPGKPFSVMNKLSFCYGSKVQCFGVGTRVFSTSGSSLNCPLEAQPPQQPLIPTGAWWVKIEAANGTRPPKYMCAVRTDHSHANIDIPPTSRWRWLAKDETMWKECLEGCCRVERI